ncbi:hypothetical protein ACJ41O_008668 [Fusarium nematophilum]
MAIGLALTKVFLPGSRRHGGGDQLGEEILQVPVLTRECLIHCHLLEQFLTVRADIEAWANKRMMPTASAWTFYVNMSADRMVKWFETSFERNLTDKIPPLDVLLVWHSMLQDPAEWQEFAKTAGFNFNQWNWDALFQAVQTDIPGEFRPPSDSLDEIRNMYPVNDLRNFMDVSTSLLSSSRPDQDTKRLADMYIRKQTKHIIKTPQGKLEFQFDFHNAVERQLQFADGIVRFSWHRMYAPVGGSDNSRNEQQFGPAIKRYCRIMTLVDLMKHFKPENWPTPSLDADLAWRTHLLMPREYERFCTGITQEGLVPHVPSIPDLNRVDEPTAKLYKCVFGEEYGLCLCWPCVAGRRSPAPGPSPRRWSFKSAAKIQTEEEVNRRRPMDMRGSIPLEFSVKQCRKCGTHARESCQEGGNSVDNGNLVARPAPPPTPPLRCVIGRPPTPGTPLVRSGDLPRGWWAEPRPAAAPSPELGPLSHPVIVSPIPRRPPIQASRFQTQPATASTAPKILPWTSQVPVRDEEYDDNVSNAMTPSLTNGSTQSTGSDQEYNGGANYTYASQGPSGWQQANHSPEDAVPRFTRNDDGTRGGLNDPAVWWIGW